MKKLLVTLLLSAGLSGTTIGAFADTFWVIPPNNWAPIKILQFAPENDVVVYSNNCNNNLDCSFSVNGLATGFTVMVGTDSNNKCIYQIDYNPFKKDKLVGLSCGGNLSGSFSSNQLVLSPR